MTDSMTQTRPQFVTRHDQRGVAIIGLANPPRNGLEPEVIAEAQSVVQEALLDADVRALVITGVARLSRQVRICAERWRGRILHYRRCAGCWRTRASRLSPRSTGLQLARD